MRKLLFTGGIVMSLLAAGCGSSGSGTKSTTAPPAYSPPAPSAPASSAPASGAMIGLASVGKLGNVLTGPDGRTLYLFEKDTSTSSTCTGSCATAWPPMVTQGAPQAGSGLQASLLGTLQRADGTMQVTYGGHPLYYFVKDTARGTAAGQDVTAFGAGWYVLGADGKKVG